MKITTETRGFEDDGKESPDLTVKSFLGTIFGNDDDKLQDLNHDIYLAFPSKYGTEHKQEFSRNDDYQLNWVIDIVAAPPE